VEAALYTPGTTRGAEQYVLDGGTSTTVRYENRASKTVGMEYTHLFVECSIEQSGLVGEHDRLNPVAEAELLEDVRDVRLHGRFADVELLADLCVG
jgi:hypothetical protein